jgi:hypothetical protein
MLSFNYDLKELINFIVMKKLNPEYLIGIGLIVACIGGIFFDTSSDIGLGITFLGCTSVILGCIIGWNNSKK